MPNFEDESGRAHSSPFLGEAHILDAALNSIRDFTYVFDRAGRFLYSNKPLLDLLGIELGEIIGKNFHELHYPFALAARLQRQIEEVFETGQVVRDETPFTGSNNQSGFYEYIFTPVVGNDGAVSHVAGTTRDITERKHAEIKREKLVGQLELESSRFAYLFDLAPAFVTVLRGPEHIFDLTNPAYLQLIGHRDVVGKTILEALPEVAAQGFVQLLNDVYQTGKAYIGHETSVLLQTAPKGPLEERFVDFVYQPMFDSNGAVRGIFVHGFDITAQVKARREAEEAKVAAEEARRSAEAANRTKDEFLATLSHELRTPLTAIRGWTSILQSGNVNPEEMELGLHTIDRNARAQGQLIEDILDVSRSITGKMRLDFQPVELDQIILESVDTAKPAAQLRSIEIESQLQAGMNLVSGDPARLRQVFWNLLTNAIKFTPRGGRVWIKVERSESQVHIVVSDTGQGITPQMLPHVFERFRQADSSSTRSHGGLGLGLALVRHLVEMHGGSVEAISPGVGKGSTFTVKLPGLILESTSNNPQIAEVSDEMPQLKGLRILVVDDQEDTRILLRVLLERFGATVTTVQDAAEAFLALQKIEPDLLISDIGMPDEDGFSLMRRIRLLPEDQGGATVAVALTAFASIEDRAKALRAGFHAHVSKPVDSAELAELIVDLMSEAKN